MSKDNRWNNDESDEEPADKRVTDESGTVDEKLKNRIIDARERVAEREDQVFVGVPLDGDVSLSRPEQLQIWATTVKQYLRTIEPLLRTDEISRSEHFYREVEIVTEQITPPDGETLIIPNNDSEERYTEQIEWSAFYNDVLTKSDIIQGRTLFGDNFEPPDPKRIELTGLKSIIETDGIRKEWYVPLNPGAIPPHRRIARPFVQSPLRKEWLTSAVRKADHFLQQAGIGLEIGHAQTDDPDNDPF